MSRVYLKYTELTLRIITVMKIMTQLLQNEDQTNKLINLKKKKKKKKEEELLMKIRINQID